MAEIFNTSDDFIVAAALELFEGIEPIGESGFSKVLTTSTESDVSMLVANTIPLPNNAGQTIQVWSTSASDTTQEIKIEGLGANGVLIDPQIITLNGTTPVDLPVQMSRINQGANISDNPIVGDVNIGVSPTTIFSEIKASFQQSKQAIYSVPAGHTFVLPRINASFRRSLGTTTVDVLMRGKSKRFEQTFFYSDIEFELMQSGNTFVSLEDIYPKGVKGPADIKVSAFPNSGSGAEVLARINGLLVRQSEGV